MPASSDLLNATTAARRGRGTAPDVDADDQHVPSRRPQFGLLVHYAASLLSAVVQLKGSEQIPLELVLWTHAGKVKRSGAHTVWILPRATRDLRDRFRKEQESYVDLRGSVFLSFPRLLVDRVNLTIPSRPKTTPRSFDPFADRSSLVVRTLLDSERHQDQPWGVRELAERAASYFSKWYGEEPLQWLEQFRYEQNNTLQVLTTVDMAAQKLCAAGGVVSVTEVKRVLSEDEKWRPKLERPEFSDAAIDAAIQRCAALFGEG